MSNESKFVTTNATCVGVTSTQQFKEDLAYWLDSYEGHLEIHPTAQRYLHDSITHITDQNYTAQEQKVLACFLNSCLALSFIVKQHPAETKTFINSNTN